mmetsp:Transcript_9169/g.15667  ORF Transcript_9169/g.15667 Transcript_9169/m.15667 type:complete len:220 (-) Transcript_9169:838-1497(-)
MMEVPAHSGPKSSMMLLTVAVAASRMEKTVSPSQPMQRLLSLSSKNSLPSCLARSGMYSMMARRTRHWRSRASSTMAGRRDWERSSMPMSLLTSSSLEMMLRRTSGKSSLRRMRKMSRRYLRVFSRPRMGASPMITEASEERTCCDESVARSLTHGMMSETTSVSSGSNLQKSVTFLADTVRTSGSGSRKRVAKVATTSDKRISGPKAWAILEMRLATM